MRNRSARIWAVATLAAMGFTVGQQAQAADDAASGFDLRFPAALARFSTYGDVAGYGGASVGSRFPSSVNPGATEWISPPEGGYLISPQYSRLGFANAPTLKIATLTAGASIPGLGAFQPSYTHVGNAGPQQGDFLLIDGHAGQIQWGKKFSPHIALGLNLNTSRFRSRAGLGGMLLADGSTATDGLRAGILWVPTERLSTGLMADYARARADTTAFNPACLCEVQFSDRSHSHNWRAGVSYMYAEQSYVYADLMDGRYTGGGAGMRSQVLFAGVEQRLQPWLFLRGGLAHDQRGTTSHTLGIGIMPAPFITIDLAYQHDMFPELRPEFGRSRLLNFSMAVLW